MCQVAPWSWLSDTANSPVLGSAPVTHQPWLMLARLIEESFGWRAMGWTLPSPPFTSSILPSTAIWSGSTALVARFVAKIEPRFSVWATGPMLLPTSALIMTSVRSSPTIRAPASVSDGLLRSKPIRLVDTFAAERDQLQAAGTPPARVDQTVRVG